MNRHICHLVPLVALLMGGSIQGQSPTFQWAKLVTPTDGEYHLKALAVGAEGHAVVASQLWIRSEFGIDPATWLSNRVTKVDSAGNTLWTYHLLPNIGRAWSMGGLAVDSGGRTYVAGSLCRGFRFPLQPLIPEDYLATVGINSEGVGGAYVARLSASGELDWFRQFGGAPAVQAQRIAVDAEGNYFVGGAYTSTAIQIDDVILPVPVPSSARNLFIVKFGPDGRALWAQAAVGASPFGDFDRMTIDDALGLRATLYKGDSDLNRSLDGIEISANHSQVQFDRDGVVVAISPVADSRHPLHQDGSFYATKGLTDSFADLTFTRYGAEGEPQWEWAPEPSSVRASWASVAVDPEGNCVLAGQLDSQSWPEASRLVSAELILGETTLSTIAASELMLAKVSREGVLEWVMQSEGQHSEYDFWAAYNRGDASLPSSSTRVSSLTVAPDGAVWVAGELGGSVRFGETLIEGPQPVVYEGIVSVRNQSPIFVTRVVETSSTRPSLRLERSGNILRLRWPAADGYILECTDSIYSENWFAVSATPVLEGDDLVDAIEAGSGSQFYRLSKPR